MLYTSELVEPVMAFTVGQFYQCDQTARLIHMTLEPGLIVLKGLHRGTTRVACLLKITIT